MVITLICIGDISNVTFVFTKNYKIYTFRSLPALKMKIGAHENWYNS